MLNFNVSFTVVRQDIHALAKKETDVSFHP